MVRRILFALLFCVTAWAALASTARAANESAASVTAADISPAAATMVPASTGEPDREWQADHPAILSVAASHWASPVLHADLANVRSGDVFIATRDRGRGDRPARHGPPHLRCTPLLI